ncbi:MAG: hypothetical protein KC478_06945 [Bacteriovoracaceae bacterium]|nr:hypothetical protein [Bacteriovoracaceae bacterium]
MKRILLPIMALAVSCQNTSSRKIASEKDLLQTITQIEQASKVGVTGNMECYRDATKYFDDFFDLGIIDLKVSGYSADQIDFMIEKSFNSRLHIKKHLADFQPGAEASEKCFSAVRNLTLALRYFEDYLIEYKDGEKAYTPLTGNGSYFLKNRNFEFKNYDDLQAGDVILSRGKAYSSAAIARIGKSDAQFSHISFVYRDEANKLYTVEAHIEIGSVVEEIDAHIDQDNSREVVLRFKDAEFAHRAASFAAKKVNEHLEKTGTNIQYDFGMDYKDSKRYFCSEVVYDGFLKGAGIDVPITKTKFNPGAIPFLNKLGIGINKDNYLEFNTFAPGDLEFDPRFELVAEWRNPNYLRQSRMQDAALTKMFEWMEQRNYSLKPSFVMSMKSYAAWLMRRTPVVRTQLGLVNDFPTNMSPEIMNTFLALEDVADVLYLELEKAQELKTKPLSFKEMYKVLEAYRIRDAVVDKRRSDFHFKFSPYGTKGF